MTIFARKVSLLFTLLAFFLGVFFTALYSNDVACNPTSENGKRRTISKRMQTDEFEYVRPLLFVEREKASDRFNALKAKTSETIETLKKSGDLEIASVYLTEFERGRWMGIQEDVLYHPGSLLKVPMLLAVLKIADDHPAFLDTKAVYTPPGDIQFPIQNYLEGAIEPGKEYTVRELLRYLISYSDNNAYWQLTQMVESTRLDKVYLELGIGLPRRGEDDGRVRANAKDYSKLLITLFNSTYCKPASSEYGMKLLADCKFREGMSKGLPENAKFVHKFGEWDDTTNFELHESGIVYVNDSPYLITIMTKGKKGRKALAGAIAAITRTIYEELTRPKS